MKLCQQSLGEASADVADRFVLFCVRIVAGEEESAVD